MTSGAALNERDRWIIVGSGVAAVALVHVGMAGVLRPGTLAADTAFIYAPHARLLLLPFGAMPYGAAVAAWSVLNLFCLFRAAELMGARRELALLACLAPAALTMVASGYAGGFLALLATVVLVHGPTRPTLAGLNLALMSVQPHFALLLALILLLIGYRRAVMWAVPWTLALLGAAVITFGIQPWSSYLDTPALAQPGAAISLFASARAAGLPEWAAQTMHGCFAVVVIALAVRIFLRRGPAPRSIALLLLAAILAAPDASADSLVLMAPALALALFAESSVDRRPLLPFVPALLLWVMPVVAPLVSAPSEAFVLATLAAAILLFALARETIGRPVGDESDGEIRFQTSRTP